MTRRSVLIALFALSYIPSQGQTSPGDAFAGRSTQQQSYSGWRDFGGSADSAQYSSLGQINRSNVNRLKVTWKYSTGDNNRYAFNPLVAHGIVYVLAHNNSIVALDAATGKELWIRTTDPQTRLITNRGINYWESADGGDRRLLFSEDNFLKALDARTGQTVRSFGNAGAVDLRVGLGRDPEKPCPSAVNESGAYL